MSKKGNLQSNFFFLLHHCTKLYQMALHSQKSRRKKHSSRVKIIIKRQSLFQFGMMEKKKEKRDYQQLIYFLLQHSFYSFLLEKNVFFRLLNIFLNFLKHYTATSKKENESQVPLSIKQSVDIVVCLYIGSVQEKKEENVCELK